MSDLPRVLFVDHTGQLGGGELSLLDLADRTPGCRVMLFRDGPFREKLERAGIQTLVTPTDSLDGVKRDGGLLGALGSARGVWQLARRVAKQAKSADVIYANSLKSWVVAALAGLMARKPRVWHLHDILTTEHFSPTNIRVVVWLANRLAGLVIANSAATRDAFIAAGGRPDRVQVIYQGIDPQPYQADDFADDEHAAQPNRPLTVACIGRLSPWKGQHIFLQAIARTPAICGKIVGAPLFGEDAYAQQLRQDAKRLGIEDRIEFMGFQQNIPDVLGRCDVLAHTSTAPEPFGRVLVEAMLAGLAVVATKGGGPSEILRDGETGLLTTPGDADQLADALGLLQTDPARRRALANAGRADALARFSLDTVVRQVHAALMPFNPTPPQTPQSAARLTTPE